MLNLTALMLSATLLFLNSTEKRPEIKPEINPMIEYQDISHCNNLPISFFTFNNVIDEVEDEESNEDYLIPVITLDSGEEIIFPYSYQRYLYKTCKEKDLDYYLVLGMIIRESRCQPSLENSLGYKGLMQIGDIVLPDMCDRIGIKAESINLLNPYDNIDIGTECLKYCMERADGDEYTAVWMYGTGVSGYYNEINVGYTSDVDADKAYSFREMLMDEELNPRK